jgi:hypothetical protein
MEDLINAVKLEINKENPNWMLISNLSRKIANEKTYTCPLGFKKGFINLIKITECSYFEEQIKLNKDLYSIKRINWVDEIPSKLNKDEINNKITIIITTNKTLTLSKKFPKDIPLQTFNGTNTFDKKQGKWKYIMKNNQTNETIKFYNGELLSIIRDRKFNKLFS